MLYKFLHLHRLTANPRLLLCLVAVAIPEARRGKSLTRHHFSDGLLEVPASAGSKGRMSVNSLPRDLALLHVYF